MRARALVIVFTDCVHVNFIICSHYVFTLHSLHATHHFSIVNIKKKCRKRKVRVPFFWVNTFCLCYSLKNLCYTLGFLRVLSFACVFILLSKSYIWRSFSSSSWFATSRSLPAVFLSTLNFDKIFNNNNGSSLRNEPSQAELNQTKPSSAQLNDSIGAPDQNHNH